MLRESDGALAEAALHRFELLGLSSAAAAAQRAGVLAALVERGHGTARELAGELGVDPRLLERILELLATTELVRREAAGDEGASPVRFDAGPALAALRRHGSAFAALELEIWRELPERLVGGPPEHRRSDAPNGERGPSYAEVVDDLSRIVEPAARRLARELEVAPAARVLDVGCGAGAWSLALTEANPDVRVTGVDLPDVVPRFVEEARRRGLGRRVRARPGDMHDVELEPERYDLVIVANVLRLETKEQARRLVERLTTAVAPDGALLVVDALPGRSRRARRVRAAYRLHLALRSAEGDPPDPAELAGWLRACGFPRSERVDLGTDAPLGALLARRGDGELRPGTPSAQPVQES